MRYARFVSFAVAVLLVSLALAGCSTDSPDSAGSSSAEPKATASESLVYLDESGKGRVTAASVAMAPLVGALAGSPEERAHDTYDGRMEIGVPDSLGDVETRLLVPMFYSGDTEYTKDGQTTRLVDAVRDKELVLRGDYGATVVFHLEDGVFVIDSLDVGVLR